MALPDEGYFICAEKGDDGAAVLTDGVVKRGVRVFMRAIASMGDSARFHANNFESVALEALSKELKQPDGGARRARRLRARPEAPGGERNFGGEHAGVSTRGQ